MSKLEAFYNKIPDDDKNIGKLIPYFAYYNLLDNDEFSACNIVKCYNDLALKPYSNIPAFLKTNSTGKNPLFLKTKCGYILHRKTKNEIARNLNEIIPVPITDTFFQMSLVKDTRGYLETVATQMCKCYESGLYDAALVMMRKLLETLIIECFERHGVADQIKNKDGHFLFLSDLIPAFLGSSLWTVGRNVSENIPLLKKKGDLSAHNRRFIAQKRDLDDCIFSLRQVVQEIILLIDYPNWNKTKKTKKAEESILV